jgi:hypothetical protein
MIDVDSTTIAKLIGMLALYLFLPLTALTYYVFRRPRRAAEVARMLSVMRIDPDYRKIYDEARAGYDFLCAVIYASVVSCLGLALLFLSTEVGLDKFSPVQLGNVEFPRAGSWFIFGMASLGAYLWGIQYIFRRYALNDLVPSVYYGLSTRMLLAAAIALVFYNAYGALAANGQAEGGVTSSLWPALALLIGMFPQRGVRLLMERVPLFAPKPNPAVRSAPIDMIEGIERHDVLRLEELAIDTCYDLATADFVPLVLKTPYSGRQLVDWILQAKLCVYFGDTVRDLRKHGIRTISDLELLSEEGVEVLVSETAATRFALGRAREAVQNDAEIKRLRRLEQLLGHFWEDEEKPEPD